MAEMLSNVAEVLARSALRSFGFSTGIDLSDLVKSFRRSESDLDDRIRGAFDSLAESSRLIDSLGEMMAERQEKLVALKHEYERISHLSTLTAGQADAVALSLEKAIGKSAARERLYAFGINILAGLLLFVIGVFASDWVKSLF